MNQHAQIYVALLNEGVEVWRPVNAEILAPDIVRILEEVPEDELWEFQPGDVVHCRFRQFTDGVHLVAVSIFSHSLDPKMDKAQIKLLVEKAFEGVGLEDGMSILQSEASSNYGE